MLNLKKRLATDLGFVQIHFTGGVHPRPPPWLSAGDGEHVSAATRPVEHSRSAAAGVTFSLSLLNPINYGSEQKPREKGDTQPATLSEPRGDCE